MNAAVAQCGVLRAGGWGNGLGRVSHVVPNEGGAGTQFLARSIPRH